MGLNKIMSLVITVKINVPVELSRISKLFLLIIRSSIFSLLT